MSPLSFLSDQPWVERLGWTLVHFLWQGALIAALYAFLRRSAGARTRYAIACVALAAMAVAPIVTFSLSGAPEPASASPYVGTLPLSSAAALVSDGSPTLSPLFATRAWRDDIMPWLVIVWFAGAIVFWIRLTGGWIVAARMRSVLVRPAPPSWQHKLDEIKARISVSRPVCLLVSALVQVPTVVGWLRPVILVPVGALACLPPEHVEALLAHELAHIRRHDYLVNILQSIAEALLFYHPAVWWISNHIREERELCCDDIAVAVSGDVIMYARALADLESHRLANLSPALAANGGPLTARIERLLGRRQSLSRPLPVPGGAVAAVLIALAAFLLPGQPNATEPSFSTISIAPGKGAANSSVSSGEGASPDSLTLTNVTARRLLQKAFGIRIGPKDFQISGGPDWLDTEYYNINATTDASAGLTDEKTAQSYLQSLLADRFHLKYHRETKGVPVYLLTVAENGPKVIEHTGNQVHWDRSRGGCGSICSTGSEDPEKGSMTATMGSMATFAGYLTEELDRAVIDNTGLNSEYDFRLEWDMDEAGNSSVPSLLAAVRDQLGLRLDAREVPVQILVIDGIEKPSQN